MFNIKKIELVFENVEVAEIDGKHIGLLLVEDIKKSAHNYGCNSFGIDETAMLTAIEIHKDANIAFVSYGEANGTVFERISRNDITSIEIYGDNDEKYVYHVIWGDDEYTNKNQTSIVGDNGNMYVVITEGMQFRYVFSEEQMKEDYWPWLRQDWGK